MLCGHTHAGQFFPWTLVVHLAHPYVKGLNKHNIRENLTQVLNDESQIEQALQLIMNNREVVVKHVLTKPKMKGKSLDT